MFYRKRLLERKFLKMSDTFKVVMLCGARQVGKSTMLKKLAEGTGRSYATMDDLQNRALAQTDPALFFQTYEPPVLIDEVQKAPALFEEIKLRCDRSDERGRFWLTGSQSRRLIERAGDTLAGRIGLLRLYGFSQRESDGNLMEERLSFSLADLQKRAETCSTNNVKDVFSHIWRGGMPDAQELDEEALREYFQSYVEMYLLRDAVDDEGISNVEGFRRFLRACAACTAQLLNYSTLAEASGISVTTAKEWIYALARMGIVYLLTPYANNALKRLVRTPKLYFCDTGLCAYLSRWTSRDVLLNGAANGHYFENYVVMELVKNYAAAREAAELMFYRDSNKKEIDLLVETADGISPLEVKLSANPDRREIKKFRLLDNAPQGRANGGIICMCEKPFPIDPMNSFIPSCIL